MPINFVKKRKILLISSLAIIAIFSAIFFTKVSQGRLKTYHSGDAIQFGNKIYVVTADTGKLEIFVAENDRLQKVSTMMSQEFNHNEFKDAMFNVDHGRLQVYAVNGYLNIINLDNPEFPVITYTKKDNGGDYFYGLTKAGNKIVTIGKKGVKVWNFDLEVTHTYDYGIKDKRSIAFSPMGTLTFVNQGDTFKVIDSKNQVTNIEIPFDARTFHDRQMFNDPEIGQVFMVDDHSLKRMSFDGSFLEFDHTSNVGFDAAATPASKYVYFSDGIGIVKVEKTSMKAVDWVYTTGIGPEKGGWAMGLEVVGSQRGERVIVFNGTSIALFDSNLNLLSKVNAHEENTDPIESLYLNLNSNIGYPGNDIVVSGGGFGANEKIDIAFGKLVFHGQTDNDGRFTEHVFVPDIYPGKTDIKVTGLTTKRTYSISFDVR